MLISVYPKKLLFFAVCIGLVVSAFRYESLMKQYREAEASIEVSADRIFASPADNFNASKIPGQYYLEIELFKDGSLKVGNKKVNEGVKARDGFDEFRYIIIDQIGEQFAQANIVVKLPSPIYRLQEPPQTIAVHDGIKSGGAKISEDGTKITFNAKDVGLRSTVTVAAYFPKGYFKLPVTKVVEGGLETIPAYFWLILGAVLPTIAVFIIIHMFTRRGLGDVMAEVKTPLSSPPANLPPAVVSALVLGRVGPRAIMATLIDLAQRGFIDIYNRGSDFVVYKKSIDPKLKSSLLPYESMLLEKIFLPSQKVADAEDVEERASRHLFSRKIALVYLGIYDYASSLGYFTELPARLHLKYRIAGIVLFFLGMIGYVSFALFGPDPKVILFLWVALVLLGMMIVKLAPSITNYTPRGRQAVINWLSFREFMVENQVFSGEDELFESYLAYSIALGVEASWSARFIEARFALPKWYDAIARIDGVENFAKSLLPITNYIAKTLNISSEPLVR